LRIAISGNEAGPLEHLEVLRDRGLRHGKRLCELVHGGCARGQPGEDGAPCRIGKRCEGGVEMSVRGVHNVNVT
jgi:hypothetical protein